MSETPRLADRLNRKLEEVWGVDLRSLALFRIALAGLVLTDLFNRAFSLNAHYTDQGVLPRKILIEFGLTSWRFCAHLLAGSSWSVAVLFVLHAVAALMLLFGWRTRLATIITWVLLLSLHNRNPVVLQGGDILLRLLLFWAMFLPLGARYSIDYALRSEMDHDSNQLISGATVAILFQVCLVYWFNAFHKYDPIWRSEYTAVHYALALDQFTKPFGLWIKQFHSLTKVLTFTTLHWEMWGPLVALCPFWTRWTRMAAVIIFIGMHIGFLLCMELGLFPYISIVCWLVFIPGSFWDGLWCWLNKNVDRDLMIYYDGDCSFCDRMVQMLRVVLGLSEVKIDAAQRNPRMHELMREHQSWIIVDRQGVEYLRFDALTRLCQASPLVRPLAVLFRWGPLLKFGDRVYRWVASHRQWASGLTGAFKRRPLRIRPHALGTIAALLLIFYVAIYNARGFFQLRGKHDPQAKEVYETIKTVFPYQAGLARGLGLGQSWNMFSPYPATSDGWYVIPARLNDGSIVDLWRDGAAVGWEKPYLGYRLYVSQRWRKYMMNIWLSGYSHHRKHYATYLCKQWNLSHEEPKQISNLVIYFVRENTLPDYRESEPTPVRLLWYYPGAAPDEPEADLALPKSDPEVESK
jgi:predicted DCC family thiol-disulfide oxidoreductase YuxK